MMGRLFWKFFFAFLASFVTAGVGVGVVISLHHDRSPLMMQPGLPSMDRSPPMFDHPLADYRGRPPLPPLPDGQPPSLLLPISTALIVSLLASALLAWYFAKPIRHLRWAFRALADGRLDTRVQPLIAGRRDEIADLGRDFDHMAQRLEQTVESQRRLLHDVSHELRSPLARLQVAVGLARQDPGRVAATFDRVETEVGRLDRLVGELLTLSRLEAGNDGQGKAPLDVIELLAGIIDDARFEAQANGRDLAWQESAEYVIDGREELLQRAFDNVVRNAIKFTQPGTTVSVSTLRAVDGRLHIRVCDHGPGVLPSELEAIFQPFHRGAGAAVDGFGLGLAIARRAIQAHDGSVVAANRDGGGLCVEIIL